VTHPHQMAAAAAFINRLLAAVLLLSIASCRAHQASLEAFRSRAVYQAGVAGGGGGGGAAAAGVAGALCACCAHGPRRERLLVDRGMLEGVS